MEKEIFILRKRLDEKTSSSYYNNLKTMSDRQNDLLRYFILKDALNTIILERMHKKILSIDEVSKLIDDIVNCPQLVFTNDESDLNVKIKKLFKNKSHDDIKEKMIGLLHYLHRYHQDVFVEITENDLVRENR